MEGLIFTLVLAALGIFFNKKKDDAGEEVPKRPETSASGMKQKAFKRVEDYAKEIYGDVQSRMEEQPEKTEQVRRKVEEVVERTPLRETRKELTERVSGGRLTAHQNRPAAIQKAPQENNGILPLSGNDVRRGIIMAEILLPPKSKR